MLGLADQVRGHDGGVGRGVGNDADLRRAGKDIDAHATKQHALGLRHEFVAGPYDDVGGPAGEQTVGHGGDGLHAAQRHHGIHAGHLHGVQDLRMDPFAAVGRGARDDHGHAGRLGGGDAHIGRGDVRIAPRGDIAARHIHGNQPLSGGKAGRKLHLKLAHRCHLRLREPAHLAGGEFNVAFDAGGDGRGPLLDLIGGHQDIPFPFVELPGVVAHRGLAAGLDPGQHFGSDFARGGLVALRRFRRGFEFADCHRIDLWRMMEVSSRCSRRP
ncbi:hypothetical protein D3C72_1050170 [compost metagenome]